MLQQKNIIVGVTGSIAAYKSVELIRRLRELGNSVQVVLTAGGQQFISPWTLHAVSEQPVRQELFDLHAEASMSHIELAKKADLIVIAPASAHFIAQLACGLAGDLLTTVCLATKAPIFVVPAMNQQMWQAPQTQENIKKLQKWNHIIVLGPATGLQACGDFGPGRLLEPEEILQALLTYQTETIPLPARVLITAGPTREAIDPVRYITNRSSGKMGYALARAAQAAGAQVTLISGPTSIPVPTVTKLLRVETAEEMRLAVMAELLTHDILIATAAVADYRLAHPFAEKIADKPEKLTLTLIKNPDILAEAAAKAPDLFTVGFAAETQEVLPKAMRKLETKQLDMIIANDVSDKECGFDSDDNAVTVMWKTGKKVFPRTPKTLLARALISLIAEHFQYSQRG